MDKNMKNWIVTGIMGVVVVVSTFSISYDGSIISNKLTSFLHTDVNKAVKQVEIAKGGTK
jgi:hypothetical protein